MATQSCTSLANVEGVTVRAQFENSSQTLFTDGLRGLLAAHPDAVWHPQGFVARRTPRSGGVALVSGGGSGHEPMHAGFVGAGMLDAACPGLVFTSPNAVQIAAATRAVDTGAGVLHIVKNYTGDVMNFAVARRLVSAEDDGAPAVETDVVLVADDVATEDTKGPGRRGTGATIVVEKICGAAADEGRPLSEVAAVGRSVAETARSMAVSFSACTVPGATEPSFELDPGQMAVGVGIHGERARDERDAVPAKELVAHLLDRILPGTGVQSGGRALVVVNNLGGVSDLELGVLFSEAAEQLAARGIEVARSLVGRFVTALDMAGASLTVVPLDDALIRLWDAPTSAPGWPHAATAPSTVPELSTERPDDSADDGEPNAWVSAFVERVQGAVDELTELDRKAGDGDFGTNMEAALGHYPIPLRGNDGDVLEAVATSYLVRAGGTSGAVFGTFFTELGRALEAAPGTPGFVTGVRAGLTAVQELGGAQVGDKTVVDALSPAADVLDAGGSLTEAAEAAAQGVEATAGSVASRGRASYLGDTVKGVPDPGALVMSWLFEAAAQHL
ncbi:Glycerone kinase OS=Tsukamurella paurometabola (strain ATCC 8368 / DSM / CCUG 35730 / CIP 100753/ JCM 10117 / KCTC 9821 / NBRC 16120 / NCIMB 702349 / NCTC 13040) OX=521096 GN=Tpau_0779 PE=4 SV=1 [Tsukamurella paurometabola]|nr:PTS-dependent dihydroxyacetone kinase, dihydroxyacetone-binding subunit dhaK [Tsukamurella paurometabola]